LPSLYSSVDLTISTSEFETFGQVLTESMACETPVVAFNYSGPAEIIEHKINGYLAEYLNINDLVSGILWCLNEASLPELKSNSRKRIVEHFSEEIISNQYVKLYKKLLNKETEI